jgi:nitrite reductase/ring-hydroxylating ferredoxin subunit
MIEQSQPAPPPRQPVRAPIRLVGAATLADGERRAVQSGGRSYLVIRDGEDRYACVNRCPHFGIRLNGGHLTGSVLECRWHHWRLDLASGAIDAQDSPFATFETYDVIVDGDDLLIAAEPKTRLRRLSPAPAQTTP